ncbi:alpha/beta hydrolase [Solimonas terrae]|uniref:Alpha/beta hydrolase n=1 Tax=Solimonas terrae TaxID=1396819 RepID=A0A6M2BSM0_9GAMM|nr:alpha/beta hydrolase [Solimonas terrae]NGY05586.1 alpha/beta hydrolase [Solimonas terrae]
MWLFGSVVVTLVALVGYAMSTDTFRQTDPQLLLGIPRAMWSMSKPTPTFAELQAQASDVRYTEKFIPGMAGDPSVRIIIVDPGHPAAGRPGMLDMHGGGYMYGSPELSMSYLGKWVGKYGFTAVSVDYRLAPGTHYPGSLHDNYAALKWFHDHAAEMGVDPARIAIMGVSAGGGHAAALSIFDRDHGDIPILFQMLMCPMLDDRTGSSFEPGASLGHLVWTREDNRKGWTALLGMPPGGADIPDDAVPMRVKDLSGLPPTFISVGSIDLFSVEDERFAQKLKAAGVPTELHVYPGGFHAFELIVPDAKISQQAMKAEEDYLVRGFELPAMP